MKTHLPKKRSTHSNAYRGTQLMLRPSLLRTVNQLFRRKLWLKCHFLSLLRFFPPSLNISPLVLFWGHAPPPLPGPHISVESKSLHVFQALCAGAAGCATRRAICISKAPWRAGKNIPRECWALSSRISDTRSVSFLFFFLKSATALIVSLPSLWYIHSLYNA